jgi:glucokinase
MAVLVGDIGGTNGRFGLLEDGGLRPERIESEPGDAHKRFEDALGAFLEKAEQKPDRAALAVAGPVDDRGNARITNRQSWMIDPEALKKRFGFSDVLVMNDFVAQAASLPHLDDGETVFVGAPHPRRAVKAAVGPGTGLGVAALLPEGEDGWRPLPSEGGHVEFAPVTDEEAAAFEIIRKAMGRVSAEYVVSGPGLARLHDALAEARGAPAPGLKPAEITEAAVKGEREALATAKLFLTMLARFAGDMALTFGAHGGVYFCGGVAPRLLPVLDARAFRVAFEAKSPHDEMMSRTATVVVTSPIAGLIGASAMAARGHV